MLTAAAVFGWFAAPRTSPPAALSRTQTEVRPLQLGEARSDANASDVLPAVRLSVTEVYVQYSTSRAVGAIARGERSADAPLPAVARLEPASLRPDPPVVPAGLPLDAAPSVPPPVAPPDPAPADAAEPPTDAAPPEVRAGVAEEAAVRAALLGYETAYSRLDVEAAGAVWPGLDRKALARAFDGLTSQRVSLGACDVRVVGEAAIAGCAGSATWTPKVGGGTRSQQRQWHFRLKNAPAGWHIVGVMAR